MARGFFTRDEIQTLPRPRRTYRSGPDCVSCKLYRGCVSPKMKPTGKGSRKFLFIAESPGNREDQRGTQLIGKGGQELRRVLKANGFDLDGDARKTSAINCRPPDARKNATPTPKEIDCCRPILEEELKRNPPDVIIPLGAAAMQALIGTRWKKALGGIGKWRGFQIPDRHLKAWICPTLDPSFVEWKSSEAPSLVFRNDLTAALALEGPPPDSLIAEKLEDSVQVIVDPEKVRKFLRWILRTAPARIAFDYETTGLKPYAEGHRIVSCAIAWKKDRCVAFPSEDDGVRLLLSRVLTDARIRKIAANLQFEEIWSRQLLGVSVYPWDWDTCLGAHVVDNRPGITSVKFQAYVNFGIMDYDSHIGPKLKSKGNSAHGFNRVDEIDQGELLIYNGVDSLIEFRLAGMQRTEIAAV